MNKLLPILLVVVLSGCASTKIISSSDHRINIEYNPAKVTAGDLITMGYEHCSKFNMNVGGFTPIGSEHDCSHFGAEVHSCAVGLMCSNKHMLTGDDYRMMQERINGNRKVMSENPKLDDVDWNRILGIVSRGLNRASKDLKDTIDRNERTRKEMEADTRLRRIEDKIR